MHSDQGRYLNSVSDLYEDEEIEYLLDDIKDLEPITYRAEDIQEIIQRQERLQKQQRQQAQLRLPLQEQKQKQQKQQQQQQQQQNHHQNHQNHQNHHRRIERVEQNHRTKELPDQLQPRKTQLQNHQQHEQHQEQLELQQQKHSQKEYGGGMTESGGVLQDFEIAGSRTGALNGADCGVGCECECDSPLGTDKSWDSHANYRHRIPGASSGSLFSGVIVYCDHTHFKSPTGFIRALLFVTTIACLTCLCTSGTVKVGLFMLPLAGRLRFMMFVTIFTLFVTSLLLFLDVTHIIYLFPFNWGKVNAWIYVAISVLFVISSSLIFHMIFMSETFTWVPRWTHHQLLVTACLGCICCLESLVLAAVQKCSRPRYHPVAEDPSMTLKECTRSPPDSPVMRGNSRQTHSYKPVPTTCPSPYPSTSRYHTQHPQQPQPHQQQPPPQPQPQQQQQPLHESWQMDDVQPCSSKSMDPYKLA